MSFWQWLAGIAVFYLTNGLLTAGIFWAAHKIKSIPITTKEFMLLLSLWWVAWFFLFVSVVQDWPEKSMVEGGEDE
jgi:hypothetical protein